MNFKRMKTNYSYLGNFVPFLTDNQQRIKNLLIDYKLQTKIEKLPDGKEVTALFFNKENVIIRFLPFRIDFDYVFSSQTCTAQASFHNACEFYKLLGEIFYDLRGARVALVSTLLIDKPFEEGCKILSNKFGISDYFGDVNEFSFRINGVKSYFEPLNSVLDIRRDALKNAQTGQPVAVLIANLDINTLAQNKEPRLVVEDAENHFSELLLEEQERINQIDNI